MDLETLLTGIKWEIIEEISKNPCSPSELAKKLNTTVANISQQLRLLQTAGLTKRKKISQLKPGKPRTQFSLADDFAVVIVAAPGLTRKKLIRLDAEQKKTLKKWTN